MEPIASGQVLSVYEIAWEASVLEKAAVFDVTLPETLATGAAVAFYRQEEGGAWARLGGTRSGNTLSTALQVPGRHAVVREGTPGGLGPSAGEITLTPRVFSPTGGFADTEVAIGFSLSAGGPVRVCVFNRAGFLVRGVHEGNLGAGSNLVRWDGRDSSGAVVEDGIYLVTVEAEGRTSTRTLAVVR